MHILGHCFGVIPATAYACQHPDRIRNVASSEVDRARNVTWERDHIMRGETLSQFANVTDDELVLPSWTVS